ncbi:hypothetical protein, partial [Streptomyces collinus]|uniref:hypothetical protein n=1 Tax=Streptomyces collinus TaxID=42684 RepID=UPI00362563BE
MLDGLQPRRADVTGGTQGRQPVALPLEGVAGKVVEVWSVGVEGGEVDVGTPYMQVTEGGEEGV